MAWIKIDPKHQGVLDLLLTSSRVASPGGRARTGPFNEIRQVVVFAAGLGATADRRRAVGKSQTTIRDSILFEAVGAMELAFALTYRDAGWRLAIMADALPTKAASGPAASGDSTEETEPGAAAMAGTGNEVHVKVMEEYAAGGFDLLVERYEALGANVSAADLLLDVSKALPPRRRQETNAAPDEEPSEDPLIAALRRRGKLRRAD